MALTTPCWMLPLKCSDASESFGNLKWEDPRRGESREETPPPADGLLCPKAGEMVWKGQAFQEGMLCNVPSCEWETEGTGLIFQLNLMSTWILAGFLASHPGQSVRST